MGAKESGPPASTAVAADVVGRGRRRWKKIHLGVDRSGVIVAEVLTDGDVNDAKTGG